MNTFPVYQVDAFTNKLFGGNPAAVCPLEEWLPDETMQNIALENNLAETVFFVKENEYYKIRWFTPTVEVKLCGHATLASAHVFYTELNYKENELKFNSLSGILKVSKRAESEYTLDFPANEAAPVTEIPEGLFEGLGIEDGLVLKSIFDYVVVLQSQSDIEKLDPDFNILKKVKSRGIITTAKGDDVDFVSRCFFPQSGINEDPVTGSAHTTLTPYWSKKLNKNILKAIQLSGRKGYVDCELKDDRVLMTGKAITYLKGEYFIK